MIYNACFGQFNDVTNQASLSFFKMKPFKHILKYFCSWSQICCLFSSINSLFRVNKLEIQYIHIESIFCMYMTFMALALSIKKDLLLWEQLLGKENNVWTMLLYEIEGKKRKISNDIKWLFTVWLQRRAEFTSGMLLSSPFTVNIARKYCLSQCRWDYSFIYWLIKFYKQPPPLRYHSFSSTHMSLCYCLCSCDSSYSSRRMK